MSLKPSQALLELNIQRHVFKYEIVDVRSFYLHVKQVCAIHPRDKSQGNQNLQKNLS